MRASHNSWTFAKPRKAWMKLIAPFAKCQDLDIAGQLTYGVTMFDLRIKVIDGVYYIAHGAYEIELKDDDRGLYDELQRINDWGGCEVRLLLENRDPSTLDVEMFCSLWKTLTKRFNGIRYFGGHGAHGEDWSKRYIHNAPNVKYSEYHASVSGKGLRKLFPRLFVRRNTKSYMELDIPCMVDFIEDWK